MKDVDRRIYKNHGNQTNKKKEKKTPDSEKKSANQRSNNSLIKEDISGKTVKKICPINQ